MGDIHTLLHEEDDRIISGEFQFSDTIFDLREKTVTNLGTNFYTPSEKINKDFENLDSFLKIGHLNTSSVPKHRDELANLFHACKFDVFGAGETFIKDHTPKSVFSISDYKFFHKNRKKRSKGGVGLYVRNEIKATRITLPNEPDQPELCFIEVTVGKSNIAIGEIYKSPLIPYGVLDNYMKH